MAEVDDASRKVTFESGEHPTVAVSGENEERRPPLKKKSSLKTSKSRSSGSVSFYETVTVRELPAEEAEDAKRTRKGAWDPAPEHDELWDGHTKDFWEQEKTIEEVRKIVVLRQMRMALQYNLGYAFYAMVANFKKRRPALEEPGTTGQFFDNDDDVVPEFETTNAEETAIRKEIRELFGDSVKGLDFPDLVQDREAFDKVYATTMVNISESKRVPGLGLLRIEELVDEIMNTEEICRMLGVQYIQQEEPVVDQVQKAVQEKIDAAVGVEEKRRGERRASIEAQNHGVPAFGERRASVERRRASVEALIEPQQLGTAATRRSSVEPVTINGRRSSIQAEIIPTRPGSVQTTSNGLSTTRRASLETPTRRGSVQPIPVEEEDEPIFASSGRAAVRNIHITVAPKTVSMTEPDEKDSEEVVVRERSLGPNDVTIPRVALGMVLFVLLACERAFHVSSGKTSRANVHGSGVFGIFIPLLIIFVLANFHLFKS